MEMHSVFSILTRKILKKYGTYCLTKRGVLYFYHSKGKCKKGKEG